MATLQVTSHSPQQTEQLGTKLAATFRPGDLVLLCGPLGSGKTCFVRGMATAYGIPVEAVHSPSYTFVNEYPGEPPLYHFDLYRLERPEHLREIGWDDYLSREGVVVVEWGDRAGPLLPRRYYRLDFAIVDESIRDITVATVGP